MPRGSILPLKTSLPSWELHNRFTPTTNLFNTTLRLRS